MILKTNATPLLQELCDSTPKTLSASTTEKSGEKLSSEFLTFKYPGREPSTTQTFLDLRPEFRDLYIYDIGLTTGAMLYSCAGGVGVTKEPYVVDMHRFLRAPTASSAIEEAFKWRFGKHFLRRRYLILREEFNSRADKLTSMSRCADLYLLWAGSGFTHRYRGKGYDGLYLPTSLDLRCVGNASRLSREKNLLFRKEDFSTLSESIINENVVVYCHLPAEFGTYGAGFRWNDKTLRSYTRILKEFHELGRKVCISATHERRGELFRDYKKMFPEFDHLTVPGFKVSELTFEPQTSEIYLFNF
jgi:hypothetical protein